MIQLNCSNCKTLLEVDDGFAGGTCRCQHCGTIQAVPKYLKRNIAKAPPLAGAVAQKHMDAQGTGLDDLASAAASSGLSSALRQKPAAAAVASPPVRRKHRFIGFYIGLLLGLAGGSAGTWYWLKQHPNWIASFPPERSSSETPPVIVETKTPANVGPPLVREAKKPAFMGVVLVDVGKDKPPVIYVLDWDESQSRLVENMKQACLRSLETLGSDTKFQLMYWNAAGKLDKWPATGAINATSDKIQAAREALESVNPKGKSDSVAAMKAALEKPSTVILFATTKSSTPSLSDAVSAALKKKSAKVDVFAIVTPAGDALKSITDKTGGVATEISEAQLARLAR